MQVGQRNVVEQVLQSDLDRSALGADAAHPLASDRGFQRTEHVFHAGSNLRATLVFALLIRRQRLVLDPLERHTRMDPLCA